MSPESATVTYVIDSAMSRFTVKAFASGLFSGLGHNPTFAIRGYSGTAMVSPDSLDSATLQVRIQANSLTVTDDVSQKDRQDIESRTNNDVLKARDFPKSPSIARRLPAARRATGASTPRSPAT